MPALIDRAPALQRALALACGLAAAAAFGAAAPALAEPALDAWMPVDVGLAKRFVHRQDRNFSSGDMSFGTERLVGTREDRVLPAPPEFPEATAELRITTRTTSNESGEQVEMQQMFVSATDSAYRVHAAKVEVDGATYLLRYPRPAMVLEENARVGRKWHVSTENVAGLEGETWGEVVGLQDARTPAGLFEKCLVVRYTGTVSGTIEIPGAGPMDVTDGEVVVTEWHAKGIGLVLSKERLRETLHGEGGVELVASIDSQSSLTEWSRSAAPARAGD